MSEQPQEDTSPARVIVIDDNPMTSETLVMLLEAEGFDAQAINESVRALESIKATPPDLVLLDVMMPGMDGLALLEAIRSHPPTAELPVIMVTALDEIMDVVRGFELGANDYLTKPLQSEVLIARVRTQVKLKRLQDQRLRDIERLRTLDALKDRFFQMAAHDLKNPLNNFTIGLNLLTRFTPQDEETAGQYQRVFEVMRDAANAMRTLIGDFLDYQALEAGQIELNLRPVALNPLIEAVVQQFHAYAERKGVSLHTALDPDLPQCPGDPDRLTQVIGNLISNAIKFSLHDTRVEVRTKAAGDRLRVEVEDNGPGIRADEIPLLFQEYARLGNRPTGGEGSTGIGLSIVRHLVELHGGDVGAESQVGAGSTFWFEIPCGDRQSEAPPDEEAS
jgi:two-component system sensor histidine kinase/response regulator